MSDWIVDRRPTDNDADKNGNVLHSDSEGVFLFKWNNLTDGDPWMPIPKPYQPPQPDTSLRASIERYVDQHYSDHELDNSCSCIQCDRRRIIEAARKWDARERVCRLADDLETLQDDRIVADNDIDADLGPQKQPSSVAKVHAESKSAAKLLQDDDIGESEHGRKYAELRASIKRMESWVEDRRYGNEDYDCSAIFFDDIRRIIKAARMIGQLICDGIHAETISQTERSTELKLLANATEGRS